MAKTQIKSVVTDECIHGVKDRLAEKVDPCVSAFQVELTAYLDSLHLVDQLVLFLTLAVLRLDLVRLDLITLGPHLDNVESGEGTDVA